MRLLNTDSLELETFIGKPPRYAILSHTWADDEILFEDVKRPPPLWHHKAGASKVLASAQEAARHGYSYIWIDTCCIDKQSSAELSESINAMFKWYEDASICFAFLSDVETVQSLARSRWFTRGWTLQELIAPRHLLFYNSQWTCLGDRHHLSERVAEITSINVDVLSGDFVKAAKTRGRIKGVRRDRIDKDIPLRMHLRTYSIHRRMSWAARRVTTREEDMAYCLGIFDVNMPLLYGEGGVKAFRRLQEEILRQSNDQSILVHLDPWADRFLAASPDQFPSALKIVAGGFQNDHKMQLLDGGLSIRLLLCPLENEDEELEVAMGILDCFMELDGSLIARPSLLLMKDREGWCRFSYNTIWYVQPGDSNNAVAFPAKDFGGSKRIDLTKSQRQIIHLYDRTAWRDTFSESVLDRRYDRWLRRPLHLGQIFQPLWLLPQARVAYGRTYPATTGGLISLTNQLGTVLHTELRAIIWIVTNEDTMRHRCAILCGSVKDGTSLQLTIADAKDLVDEDALRTAEKEPSNGTLDELLSQDSILKRLRNVPRLPPFNAAAFSTLPSKTGLQRLTVSAIIVQSAFLESPLYDLRIGVKL